MPCSPNQCAKPRTFFALSLGYKKSEFNPAHKEESELFMPRHIYFKFFDLSTRRVAIKGIQKNTRSNAELQNTLSIC
jgi:hypothetical protein